MAFKEFSDAEFQHVRSAVHDVERIKGRAHNLMEKIKGVCDSVHPKERWGIDLQIGEGGLVTISTPYGPARARLLLSVGKNGIQGRYLIEKVIVNRLDQVEWLPVWVIRLEEYRIYAGDESVRPLQLSGYHDDNEYAALALSILYAIATGSEE